MRGDFTRLTFKPQKRFNKVLMQQGRVQLDQDWNEQMEILARRWELQTRDMIGAAGVPLLDPGLGVTYDAQAGRLLLSPGRVYVDGLLCEALPTDGAPLSLGSQPFAFQLDGAPPLFTLPTQNADRTDLVYMKAWERHVGAVEDADLLDPALGGVDTATRTQTVWQVFALPVPDGTKGDTGLPAWDALTAAPTGRLSTKQAAGDLGFAADGGGYRGLENRLYRVEVHDGGDAGSARFKWSRDNGSVAVAVTEINKQYVTVLSLGRDQFAGLAPGQWVEVIDDEHEFMQGKGLLAQIKRVVEGDAMLELTADVSAMSGSNPRLRRWDMVEGPLAMTGDWQELELGIQVQFHPGIYRPGDYWTFAARAATADVEALQVAAPQGVDYRYYKLALVRWHWVTVVDQNPPTVLTCQIDDLRYHFPALAFPKQEVPPHNIKFVPAGADFGLRLQQAAQALPDGGCLVLPEGYVTLERPVRFENLRRITICGVEGGATRLLYTPADPAMPAFAFVGCTDVTLDGLCLYSKDAHALVQAEQSDGLRLTGCRLVNFGVDGVGLWSGSGINRLQVENTDLVAAAGVVSLDRLLGATFRQSALHCYRAGVIAKSIQRLDMADCRIDFAGDRLTIAATGLTPANLAAYEQATFADQSGTVTLPLGIFAPDGEHWRLHNVQITAGIAAGAFRLVDLNLQECQFLSLAGVFAVEGLQYQIAGCRMRSQLAGAALLTYGTAKNWCVTDSTLSGLPWSIRLGPIGQDGQWVSAINTAIRSGAFALITPTDFAEAGPGISIPALTNSTWLADALAPLLPPELLTAVLAKAATGSAEALEIRSNLLTGICLLEGCAANKVAIAENRFETERLTSVSLRGTSSTGPISVAANLISTGGSAVSSDLEETLIVRNQVTLTDAGQARTDLLAVGAALQTATATKETGANLYGVSGATFRYYIRNLIGRLTPGAGNAIPDPAFVADFSAGFKAALAAYTAESPEKRLNALLLQQVSAAAYSEAARTLVRWADYMAVNVLRPAFRCSRSRSLVEANVVRGDASAGGSIVVEPLPGPSLGRTTTQVAVRGNRLGGGMRGHGILVYGPLRSLTIADNQLDGMGGIMVNGSAIDLTVTGNRVSMAAARSDQWFRHQSAIALDGVVGQVTVGQNQVQAGSWGALFVSSTGQAAAVVTGNTLDGYKQDYDYYVKVDAPLSTVVMAQNHISYNSDADGDVAVQVNALRATLTGNLILENGTAEPLAVTAESYALVANVTNKPLPETTSPTKTSQNNVRSLFPYPNDPQVRIIEPVTDGKEFSDVVRFRIAAMDRNADVLPGVDQVGVYANSNLVGFADYDAGANVWLFDWDLVATKAPYGTVNVSVKAHSTARDTEIAQELALNIVPVYPTDPQVSFTSHTNGQTVDPGTIVIKGKASDRNAPGAGINAVMLSLDGEGATGKPLGGATIDASGNWAFTWNQTNSQLMGTHTLYAVATSARGGRRAVTQLTLTIRSSYPNDPVVTLTAPAANQTVSGAVQVTGRAYDRNTPAMPGVDSVKILVKEGTSTTARELGSAAILNTNGDFSYTFNTNSVLTRDITLVAAAHSVPQDLTRSVELPVKADFPSDPALALTSIPSGFIGGFAGSYAVFYGWAFDRRSTADTGIRQIDVYQSDSAGTLTPIGSCTLNLVSPISSHAGTRFANCGFQFNWSPTGGTGPIEVGLASLSSPKSTDSESLTASQTSLSTGGGNVTLTFVFRVISAVDGKSTDQSVTWSYNDSIDPSSV